MSIATKIPNFGLQINRIQPKLSIQQDKVLREQLHMEIENKSKVCSNSSYECSLARIPGYEFCLKHILQDPRAPYKQCAYIYSATAKRCLQAAPRGDHRNKEVGYSQYCFEHSRTAQISKTHATLGTYKKAETNDAMLNDLSHYVKVDKYNKKSVHNAGPLRQIFHDSQDEEIDVISPCIDPFQADSLMPNNGRSILDYASDTSSDDEQPMITNLWRGVEMDNSDNESVDSQNEDHLKHAGIYTTEEVTMLTKEKMARLQQLYIDQINRLQHLYREKRRKYLQSIKKEKETMPSIHQQTKNSPQERHLYEKLKALNRYNRRNGVEAILHKKFIEKRIKATDGMNHKVPFHVKCIYTEGGVKCGERIIPCSKYCRKHITEDKKQILFRICGVDKGGVICQEPVANISDDATCVLHIELPPQKVYAMKKYESESDDDDCTASGIVAENFKGIPDKSIKEEMKNPESDEKQNESVVLFPIQTQDVIVTTD